MLILGIDPALSCGWALLDGERRVASGVWRLNETSRKESDGVRFLRLRRHLIAALEERVELVAYEEVRRHMGTSAAHLYGGCVATIASVCEEHGVPVTSVPVAHVKQQATGKGNADKAQMVAAARERFSIEPSTDDEADALFVALTAGGHFAKVKRDPNV
jgi:Holliday junction resolvasome RuvABC endonuclease subunit